MLAHSYANPQPPRRILILGAGGFLGRNLVSRIKTDGVDVHAIGRSDIDLAGEGAAQRLVDELKTEDSVVFLAALTPDKGRGTGPFLANMRMASAVAAALEHVTPNHLVYVSSDAVYPFRSALINESSPAEPSDLYSAMHISRELMLKQAIKVPLAVLRPTLIYGAGDTHNSYGPNRFRRMARKDGRITLFGQGEETRDHIFVDDVVSLISQVLWFRSSGTLNVASGRSIDYGSLARLIASQFPDKIDVSATPRQNPITHRAFDISATFRAFPGFRFTPLEDGLAASLRQEPA